MWFTRLISSRSSNQNKNYSKHYLRPDVMTSPLQIPCKHCYCIAWLQEITELIHGSLRVWFENGRKSKIHDDFKTKNSAFMWLLCNGGCWSWHPEQYPLSILHVSFLTEIGPCRRGQLKEKEQHCVCNVFQQVKYYLFRNITQNCTLNHLNYSKSFTQV